jgi:tetratricopeptide (TPR) repeat protein
MVAGLFIFVGASHAAGQSPANDAAQTGFDALQRGDTEKAAAIFNDALGGHPHDPALLYGAGVAAHLQGRERDASRLLKAAIGVEPRMTPASALLGEIAYHEGDLDLAIKTYESALAYAPAEVELRRRLATWRGEADLQHGFEAYKDDRFSILFEGPVNNKLATRATSVLGAAFWRIGRALGAYPTDSINVILYTDKQFRDVTGAPEWSGGGFDGQIRMPVRGVAQSLVDFDRVLTHELTHAMLKSLAPRNMPAWLNEGLAMYFDGSDGAASERRLAAAHVYIPLAALRVGFTTLSTAEATLAYEVSAFAVHALIARLGTSNLGILLQDLDAGQSVEAAVERFGFTFTEFESGLARRVGARLR